jgi:hypothetical protein
MGRLKFDGSLISLLEPAWIFDRREREMILLYSISCRDKH